MLARFRKRFISLKRFLCEKLNHRWKYYIKYKRVCTRCGTEEYLMLRKYNIADEPQLYWKNVNVDNLYF